MTHSQNFTLQGSEDFGRASSLVNASPAIKVAEWRRNTCTTHKLNTHQTSFCCWYNFKTNFKWKN